LFLLVIEFFISNRENNFLKKVFSFGDAKWYFY
jgi:hypothetical protein